MSRQLLTQIKTEDWDNPKTSRAAPRTRFLQDIDDLFRRPVLNRLNVSTSATAVTCNGSTQSTGIGTSLQQPKRYAEFTVKARVTFNINSTGPAYIYVFRTTGNIPANGAAPNVGDVAVGGDAFIGGPMVSGVNQAGTFSFLDTGLSTSGKYRYYFVVNGPNGNVLNLINSSQLLVMERS